MMSEITLGQRELESAVRQARALGRESRLLAARIPEELRPKAPPKPEPRRVLLILEDDRDQALALAELATRVGHEPLVTHSLSHVMQILADPNVVIERALVDWMLPRQTGVTFGCHGRLCDVCPERSCMVVGLLLERGLELQALRIFTGVPAGTDPELERLREQGVQVIEKPNVEAVHAWLKSFVVLPAGELAEGENA